jgi:hypothetical protein
MGRAHPVLVPRAVSSLSIPDRVPRRPALGGCIASHQVRSGPHSILHTLFRIQSRAIHTIPQDTLAVGLQLLSSPSRASTLDRFLPERYPFPPFTKGPFVWF